VGGRESRSAGRAEAGKRDEMIRAVLDVNVLVSGFPAPTGIPAAIIDQWLDGTFELVVSEHILNGVRRAWERPYFQARYAVDRADRQLRLLPRRATQVLPAATVHGVAEHDEDDLVLATAVAGNADYLVTGDRALLRLGSFERIAIVSPRDFLEVLLKDESGRTLAP
jgi:putative PIN family toxin of toxin-antitoxin system